MALLRSSLDAHVDANAAGLSEIARKIHAHPELSYREHQASSWLCDAARLEDVTLEIVETEPVIKNQTAASSFKPALLSNGVRTMVPPHVASGTRVVIMTDDNSYVERAKD